MVSDEISEHNEAEYVILSYALSRIPKLRARIRATIRARILLGLARMSFEHISRDLVSLFALETPFVLSRLKSCGAM